MKSDRTFKINPWGKFTVSESPEFLLGKVDNLWAVAPTSETEPGSSLKNLTKIRISQTFDEYKKVRISF